MNIMNGKGPPEPSDYGIPNAIALDVGKGAGDFCRDNKTVNIDMNVWTVYASMMTLAQLPSLLQELKKDVAYGRQVCEGLGTSIVMWMPQKN